MQAVWRLNKKNTLKYKMNAGDKYTLVFPKLQQNVMFVSNDFSVIIIL